MPRMVQEAVEDIEDLVSPVAKFVREECIVRPSAGVDVKDLYEHWRTWCVQEGRSYPGPKQSLGRQLNAAVSDITRRQGTHGLFYDGIELGNDA